MTHERDLTRNGEPGPPSAGTGSPSARPDEEVHGHHDDGATRAAGGAAGEAASVPSPSVPPLPPRLPAPVSASERIAALDVLRGFAVLGILVINIQSYAMVSAAYLNPAANDKLAGIGLWAWGLTHVLADQKFMTIFSILFGAGMVIMTSRAQARSGSWAGPHYRRQLGLLVLGLMHAYLIWYGDILAAYAICALVAVWFRRLPPGWLLALGLLVVSISSLLFLMVQASMPYWPQEVVAEQRAEWAPPPEAIASEIEMYRGGWLAQMEHRVPTALVFQTLIFFFWGAWRAGGLMLVGMGLFKLGVLGAERTPGFYRRLAVAGPVLGLPLVIAGVWWNLGAGFAYEVSMFGGSQFNYWGSIGVSLGYIAIVMLAVQGSWLPGLQRRLAAVGRMALTSYLAQSVICTLIFYGHGLGLFERVNRPGQILVVALVFAFQLWVSPWWLARFRFGPAEWVLRAFAYVSLPPMRVAASDRARP